MKYLLDVNGLIAFGFRRHLFHAHVASWMRSCPGDQFLTCSITELGFVRILASVRAYGVDIPRARELLFALKESPILPLHFLSDSNDISSLPSWVRSPGQTTDGHLVELAKVHGALLATLDQGIRGAFMIPARVQP